MNRLISKCKNKRNKYDIRRLKKYLYKIKVEDLKKSLIELYKLINQYLFLNI